MYACGPYRALYELVFSAIGEKTAISLELPLNLARATRAPTPPGPPLELLRARCQIRLRAAIAAEISAPLRALRARASLKIKIMAGAKRYALAPRLSAALYCPKKMGAVAKHTGGAPSAPRRSAPPPAAQPLSAASLLEQGWGTAYTQPVAAPCATRGPLRVGSRPRAAGLTARGFFPPSFIGVHARRRGVHYLLFAFM